MEVAAGGQCGGERVVDLLVVVFATVEAVIGQIGL
jgi:hypothetical protein